jgi:DNA-binding NtrC family response regulator
MHALTVSCSRDPAESLLIPLRQPAAPAREANGFEALVYVRQSCTVHDLPATGTWRVGRGPDNDIRLDEPSVSRHHLLLHLGATLEIEDLGSANGTLLFPVDQEGNSDEATRRGESNERLHGRERRAVAPGDLVRIGIALLVIQTRRPARVDSPSRLPSLAPRSDGPAVLLDPEMKRAYDIAQRAAQSGVSVLITGETGSGKEIFADTIHRRSNRKNRAFLRLNCAALPESLLESELFGHERGAFTGANVAKAGLLESTDQGTVFLDEVGEMPLTTQAKLLRVLEERSILRVGATKPRPIDVRFIWATNRDLRAEARAGRFRNDLYYRIAGVEFKIPPLRQRRIEIEPLARHFLTEFCNRSGLPVPELSPGAIAALNDYSWPGNVRELKNVLERAPFLCDSGPITSLHIPSDEPDLDAGLLRADEMEATDVVGPARQQTAPAPTNRSSVAPFHDPGLGFARIDHNAERQRIQRALDQCAGNQTRAAVVLGLSRRTLVNRLGQLSLPRPKK